MAPPSEGAGGGGGAWASVGCLEHVSGVISAQQALTPPISGGPLAAGSRPPGVGGGWSRGLPAWGQAGTDRPWLPPAPGPCCSPASAEPGAARGMAGRARVIIGWTSDVVAALVILEHPVDGGGCSAPGGPGWASREGHACARAGAGGWGAAPDRPWFWEACTARGARAGDAIRVPGGTGRSAWGPGT